MTITFRFDTPFFYDPSQGNLLTEISSQQGVTGTLVFDQFHSPSFEEGGWSLYPGGSSTSLGFMIQFELATLVGDCDGNGIRDARDLACVTTSDGRDAVLADLNSLPGDLNGDAEVNFEDFLILSANFGQSGTYVEGNIDLENGVDFADFLALSANFGATPPMSTVPEPKGIAVVWVALACLGVRKLGTIRRLRRWK